MKASDILESMMMVETIRSGVVILGHDVSGVSG